jgi:hypothetical protein
MDKKPKWRISQTTDEINTLENLNLPPLKWTQNKTKKEEGDEKQ